MRNESKKAKFTRLADMTYKSMIIQAMEDAPESILPLVYEFLELLKSKKEKHHSLAAVDQCIEGSLDYGESAGEAVNDIELLSGMLYRPGQSAISIEEMDIAIAKNAMESNERIRHEYTSSLPDEG
ncbi:MAG: hypothetical protein WA949_10115 [Phormidesmis sp.]